MNTLITICTCTRHIKKTKIKHKYTHSHRWPLRTDEPQNKNTENTLQDRSEERQNLNCLLAVAGPHWRVARYRLNILGGYWWPQRHSVMIRWGPQNHSVMMRRGPQHHSVMTRCGRITRNVLNGSLHLDFFKQWTPFFNTKNDHSFLRRPKLIQSYVSETVKWKFCHAQIHLLKLVVLIVFCLLN